MSELPSPQELRAVWRVDPADGMAWECPDCGEQWTLGCNAAHHAIKQDHGLPSLSKLRPPPAPPLPGVRVGDAMQLRSDFQLALELAETAINVAVRAGAANAYTLPLVNVLGLLRATAAIR